MPRFYFDVENGGTTIDDDGRELPSVDAAKAEALSALGDVSRDFFIRGHQDGHVAILVRDDKGAMLEVSATIRLKIIADRSLE